MVVLTRTGQAAWRCSWNALLVLHLAVTMRADTRLWEHAVRTKDDFLGRLAVVPLVQEARGLDAGVYASVACLLPAS